MASDETPAVNEAQDNSPMDEAIAQLESELLTGDWDTARETLDTLQDMGAEGQPFAELGPAMEAIAKDDDEDALLHLLELRHHTTNVDEALYNLVAIRLEENNFRLLAAGAFQAIHTRHGMGEHARCLQTLGVDEDEWAEQFGEAMEELLRDHLARHSESALAWESLAKHLTRGRGGVDEAREAARRAIAIDPQRWTARAVDVSLATDATRGAAQGALLQSIAEAKDPPTAVIDYGLGCALELGRESEAQALLDRIPEDTPEAVEALGDLAPRARQRRALALAISCVADSSDVLALALLEGRFDELEARGALTRIAGGSLLEEGEKLSAAACLLRGGENERTEAMTPSIPSDSSPSDWLSSDCWCSFPTRLRHHAWRPEQPSRSKTPSKQNRWRAPSSQRTPGTVKVGCSSPAPCICPITCSSAQQKRKVTIPTPSPPLKSWWSCWKSSSQALRSSCSWLEPRWT
ncbi:MAG: hypothetical protein JRH20_00520, partial [Deltaproteobacteria bacterium]|nr:hypothetical protein [Deltaproteobacteria bacterium]